MTRFERAHKALTLAADALETVALNVAPAKVEALTAEIQVAKERLMALHDLLHEQKAAINTEAPLPSFDAEALSLKDLKLS